MAASDRVGHRRRPGGGFDPDRRPQPGPDSGRTPLHHRTEPAGRQAAWRLLGAAANSRPARVRRGLDGHGPLPGPRRLARWSLALAPDLTGRAPFVVGSNTVSHITI